MQKMHFFRLMNYYFFIRLFYYHPTLTKSNIIIRMSLNYNLGLITKQNVITEWHNYQNVITTQGRFVRFETLRGD